MPTSDRYYRSSGVVPTRGLLLTVGSLAVCVTLLSLLYALAGYYFTYFWAKGFALLAFSFLIAKSVLWLGRSGGIRSGFYSLSAGLLTSLAAVYLMWMWFVWILSDYEILVSDPVALFGVVVQIGQLGLWDFEGNAPTGWALYSIWLAEAGLLVGITLFQVRTGLIPFCEACNAWTVDRGELAVLRADDPAQLRQDLEDENYTELARLASGIDIANYLQAWLHSCPACDESHYLSIRHLRLKTSRLGEKEARTKTVVQYLRVPAEVAELLPALNEIALDAGSDDADAGGSDGDNPAVTGEAAAPHATEPSDPPDAGRG